MVCYILQSVHRYSPRIAGLRCNKLLVSCLCLSAVLVSAAFLAVSLLHYLHSPTHTEALDYLKYVALGAIALEAPLVGLKAFASLRRKARSIIDAL